MVLRQGVGVGLGLCLVSAGCFSSPPSVGPAGESSSGGDGASTSGPGITTDLLTTSTSASATVTTTDVAPTSSSSSDASGSGSESAVTGTSGPGDASTTEEDCPPGSTPIDDQCLEPWMVTDTTAQLGALSVYQGECITQPCPAGSVPLAAGFELENVSLSAAIPDLDASWAQLCGDPVPAGLSRWAASAQCGVGEGDVITVVTTDALDPDDSSCMMAACPSGTTMVGGGAEWSGPFGLQTMRPTAGNHWEVCGNASGEVTVDTHAQCAIVPDQTPPFVVTDLVNIPGGGSTACVSVECPNGGVLLAGGARLAVGTGLIRSAPDSEGGWRACGSNVTGFTVQLEVSALCLP